MKIRTIACAAALVGGLLTLSATLPTQDAGTRAEGEAPAGGMEEMTAMMEAYMKAGMPGEQHAQLATWEGRWDLVVKHWGDPAMPPSESRATSTFKMAMDGRFLFEDVEGTTPMGPFTGMGLTAFDNVVQKYVNIWIDSTGTGVMIASSTAGSTDAIDYAGEFNNPMTGGPTKFRSQMQFTGPDERTFLMWEDRDGTEVKSMEINYKRAQG
ncbi:MAG: DUF1579 family protein [Planctomycetota bacterium]|jgi:hypothetical protein